MSEERDPETDQQLPIPNDRTSCQDMVIADIENRKALGLKKYGTLLQPFNGRSFLQDAYEEVLDLSVYLRGKLEEERENRAERPTFTREELADAIREAWAHDSHYAGDWSRADIAAAVCLSLLEGL